MLSNWVIPVLLQVGSQPNGLIVWAPTISGIAVFIGGLIVNGFIFGKAYGNLVDRTHFKEEIEKRVDVVQYNKDNKDIHEKINLKADKEVLKTYMELTNSYYLALHERMQKIEETQAVTTKETTEQYRIITNSLSSLNAHVENIEKKLN